MRALAVPLFVLLCAALACAQSEVPSESPSETPSGVPPSGPPSSTDVPAPPPTSGDVSLDGTPDQVILPAWIHLPLLDKLTNASLPAIIERARNTTVEGKTTSEFEYENVTIEDFDIGGYELDVSDPRNILLSLHNVSLVLPSTRFSGTSRVVFVDVTCSGAFTVNMSGTSIAANVSLTLDVFTGRLSPRPALLNVTYGDFVIGTVFDDSGCNVAAGTAQDTIRTNVQSTFRAIARSLINEAFRNITSLLAIPLANLPIATNDSVSLDVLAMVGNATAPATNESVRLRASIYPQHDAEVLVTEEAATTMLRNLWALGAFDVTYMLPFNTTEVQFVLPGAYEVCPNCTLWASARFTEAPEAAFDARVGAKFTHLLGTITADGPNGTMSLMTMLFNGTIEAYNIAAAANGLLEVQLALPTFSSIVNSSASGEFDNDLWNTIAEAGIKYYLVPVFNFNWLGYLVPPFSSLAVTDAAVHVQDHEATIGMNFAV